MALMHDADAPSTNLPPHAPILGDDDVIEGTIVPNPLLILELTLNLEESQLLSAAASAAKISTARYIKQTALEAARKFRDAQGASAAD